MDNGKSVVDLKFVDAILLSNRFGKLRYDEQKVALVAAARAATDAVGFLRACENFGIARQSALHAYLGQVLAASEHYRNQYPGVLGLRRDNAPSEPFLSSQRVLFLVEGVLTKQQYSTFEKDYYYFVNNHSASCPDGKGGMRMGIYVTEPRDNITTLARFEEYMKRRVFTRASVARKRYEAFPLDIILEILKRAFLA